MDIVLSFKTAAWQSHLLCCAGLEETASNCPLLAFFLPFVVFLVSLMPSPLISSSNGSTLLNLVVSGAETTWCLWSSSLLMHRCILMHVCIFPSSAVAFWMWGEAHNTQETFPLPKINVSVCHNSNGAYQSQSRKQDAPRRDRQLFNPIKAQ